MKCCENLLNAICDPEVILFSAGITAGSTAGAAASGASGALVGITAATGALYGVTAGVVFLVSLGITSFITYDDTKRILIASILAIVGATLITSAVLGVKVTLAAGLMMTAASAVAVLGLYTLATEIVKGLDECCSEKPVRHKRAKA